MNSKITTISQLLLVAIAGLMFECLGNATPSHTTDDLPVCEEIHDAQNPPVKIGDFSRPIRQIKFQQNSNDGRPDYIIVENIRTKEKIYLEERGESFPFVIIDDHNKQEIGKFRWSTILDASTGGPCIEINSNVQCRVRQLRWLETEAVPIIHMQCTTNNKKVHDFSIRRAGKDATLLGGVTYPEDIVIMRREDTNNSPLRYMKCYYRFCLKERSEDELRSAKFWSYYGKKGVLLKEGVNWPQLDGTHTELTAMPARCAQT